MIKFFAILLLTVTSLTQLHAVSLVEEGFADFRARGAAAATKTWSRESADPLLMENARLGELVAREKQLGPLLGHEVRFENNLGSGSRIFLISARFEKAVIFFRVIEFTDTLKKPSISLIRWSMDPAEVWPERVLYYKP